MRRHRRDLAPMATMNLTSLLDITFVLLIAFMIVAPTLKHGLEIDLPEVKAGQALKQEEPLVIVIQNRKDPEDLPRLYVNSRRVDLNDLESQVHAAAERNPRLNVIVECDQQENAGILLKVIGRIRSAGVLNIGLASKAEQSDSR